MTFESWNRYNFIFFKSWLIITTKYKIFGVLKKSHPRNFWKFHPWTLITISHIFIIIFLRWRNFCRINFETYNTQKCRSCFEIAISNQNRCGQDTKGDTVEVTIKQRNCFNILWTKSHSWRHQIVRMTSENEKRCQENLCTEEIWGSHSPGVPT